MLRAFIKNQNIKNVLSALAVAVFGFILLNITFLFDFLFQTLIRHIIGFFTPDDLYMDYPLFPPVMHILFVVVIGLISWFVLASKLRILLKAIYMTVPLAVLFVTLGMLLYRWPMLAYGFSVLIALGILAYFRHTRQPWLYYYTVLLVGTALAAFSLSGGEI